MQGLQTCRNTFMVSRLTALVYVVVFIVHSTLVYLLVLPKSDTLMKLVFALTKFTYCYPNVYQTGGCL